MQAPPVFTSLTIQPSGFEVFTDLKRSKALMTLLFRRKDSRLETALAFAPEVVAAITRSDFTLAGKVDVHISPEGGRFRCLVKASVTGGQD